MKVARKSLDFLLWWVYVLEVIFLTVSSVCYTPPALAQSIQTSSDGTGTIVNVNGNQFNITGGSFSGDGRNLFHSFQQFGLDSSQVANFLSNPQINNILGRVVGGDPSIINGLIQVTGGNSNLYLMNPAGIVFGSSASLNVPGDFTVTTATGIGFGDNWFESVGSNDYQELVGNPTALAFDLNQPGSITNAGDLGVEEGKSISLVGGKVINTGTITASDGGITIAAVPGTSKVKISKPGNILSLEIEPPRDATGKVLPIKATDLPKLLTGAAKEVETGLNVNDGVVKLKETTISGEGATAIVSGKVDGSGSLGKAQINILGDVVGVVDGEIDASGSNGGGEVLIGGGYKGEGTVPNAQVTYISEDSTIKADATDSGDGGRVIAWSDETSRIYGEISATGGVNGGDGGFVETSSKGYLDVKGNPDVSAVAGDGGTWLVDPNNIEIVDNNVATNINNADPFESTDDDAKLGVQQIITALTNGTNVSVTTGTGGNNGQVGNITLSVDLDFDGVGAAKGLTLDAANNIVINGAITDGDAADDSLNLTLNAGNDITIDKTISTEGGAVNFNAGSEINVNQSISTGGGAVAFDAGDGVDVARSITTAGGSINIIGNKTNNSSSVDIKAELNAGVGDINLTGNKVRVSANLSGSGAQTAGGTGTNPTLTVTDGANTWDITGSNQGTVDGLSFTNFSNLTGGGNTDTFNLNSGSVNTINGEGGNDTFNLQGGSATTIDGGGGSNEIVGNNTATTWTVDGANKGTVAGTNFDDVQTLTGGNAADTFDLENNGSITTVKGGDGDDVINLKSGSSVTTVNGEEGDDTFNLNGSSVTTVNGGENGDQFNFNSGSVGTVNGGGGNDSFTFDGGDATTVNGGNNRDKFIFKADSTATVNGGVDNDSFTFNSGKANVVNGQGGEDTFTFDGGDATTVNGGDNNDTIQDASSSATTWEITGEDTGNVNSTSFSEVEKLEDSGGNDTYSFTDDTAKITGSITDDGGDNDVLDYSAFTTDPDVNLGSLAIIGIEKIQGSSTVASTLTGGNTNNTWEITGTNSGKVNDFEFTNFAELVGGTDVDTFELKNGGSVTDIVGGDGDNDTLTRNSAAGETITWNITENNVGNVDGSSFSQIETLNGADGNDTFAFSNNGNFTGTINGNGGTNKLDYSSYTNTLVVNLASLKINGISEIVGSPTNTDLTLRGENNGNIWDLNTTNSIVDGIKFSNFKKIQGGNNADTFKLNSGSFASIIGNGGNDTFNLTSGSVTSVSGGTGSDNFKLQGASVTTISGGNNNSNNDDNDTITGNNLATIWNITGTDAGTVGTTSFDTIETLNSGNAVDTFNLNAGGSIDNINAGSGNDSITLNGGTVDSLDGGDDTDTITGDAANRTWNVTGNKQGNITNGVDQFSNVENLTGGAGVDTFNLENGSTIVTVNGGDGDDLFNLKNGSTVTNIDGGGGTKNEIFGSNTARNWIVNGTNSGTVAKSGAGVSTNFNNIQTLTGGNQKDLFQLDTNGVIDTLKGGGGDEDTIVGPNQDNLWLISGADEGTVNDKNQFSEIEVLDGNNGVDTFKFEDGATFGNIINGNGNKVDILDYSLYTSDPNVNLADLGANGIERVDGPSGITATLTGANLKNNWNIDSLNSGAVINSITQTTAVDGEIKFNNFSNIVGGNVADTFNLNGGSIKNINGSGGDDAIVGNDTARIWNITGNKLGNVDSTNNFQDIEILTGGNVADTFNLKGGSINNINGSGGDDAIVSDDTARIWNVTGNKSGNVDNTNIFQEIETLTGGNEKDTFNLKGGSINNINSSGGDDSINLNGGNANKIDAGDGVDTIFGDNSDRTWNLTANNQGSITSGTNEFSNVENLTGGDGVDMFNLNEGIIEKVIGGGGDDRFNLQNASPGKMDGGSGNNTLTSTKNSDHTWNIIADSKGYLDGFEFSNMQNLVGGDASDEFTFKTTASVASVNSINGGLGNNKITGSDTNNTWSLTAFNQGRFNNSKETSFKNIQRLIGGTQEDNFVFDNSLTPLNSFSFVSGSGGKDTLDYSKYTDPIIVDLNQPEAESIEVIIGTNDGDSTLIGNNLDSTWTITTFNGGQITNSANTITFGKFKNIVGGNRNDSFVIQGGGFTSITGGDGQNTLVGNDQVNNWEITGNNAGTLNNNSQFEKIQILQGNSNVDTFTFNGGVVEVVNGGSGIDIINGDNQNNTWQITSSNAGNLNNDTMFTSIETLNGNDGEDTFSFNNFVFFNGKINGGAGGDTLDYTNHTSSLFAYMDDKGDLRVSNTQAENITNLLGGQAFYNYLFGGDVVNNWNITETDGGKVNQLNFRDFNRLYGGSKDDTFAINGGSVNYIYGDLGNNTLIGDNQDNNWTIFSTDRGWVNNVGSFSRIQNLIGGNSNDTINFWDFYSYKGRVTGNIDGRGGDLTLVGNEISYEGELSGTDNLAIQPSSPFQTILVGNQWDTNSSFYLDLTAAEINNIQDGFQSITIGQENAPHSLYILDDTTFNDPVTLQSRFIWSGGNNIIGKGNASVDLITSSGISVGDITTEGEKVTLKNNINTIRTRNIITNGGDVSLENEGGAIITEDIDTSGLSGGNVDITAELSIRRFNLKNTLIAIDAENINTSSSSGNGGKVSIEALGNIRIATINTEGAIDGGEIDITTDPYIQITDTFTSSNGLRASISSVGGVNGGKITIRHGGQGLIAFKIGDSTVNGSTGTITSGNFLLSPIQAFSGKKQQGNILITPDRFAINTFESRALPTDPLTSPLDGDADSTITRLEEGFSDSYTNHLGLDDVPSITLEQAQNTLRNIENITGVRSGLVYVFFKPTEAETKEDGTIWQFNPEQVNSKTNIEQLLPDGQESKPTDQLEIVLVTSSGDLIRQSVEGATREEVTKLVNRFRRNITNVNRPTAYRKPAQELYGKLIRPIEDEIQGKGLNNISFIMDVGLRSLPVAALHDGEQFFIEKYSLGFMPSLSLTDPNYQDLRKTSVLAMGASKFTEKSDLPAVTVELSNIVTRFGSVTTFQEEEFTINNLLTAREQDPFGIIHLATHAEFESGRPENSYIHMGNEKLSLDQLKTLQLNNPQVDLLVLSACRTALGDEEAELGFAGSAAIAGVKSVLGSLWSVHDEGTLGLMSTFYEQLHKVPVKAQALQEAQLAMLRGEVKLEDGKLIIQDSTIELPEQFSELGDLELTHPYYWSGFTMVGNPW